MLNIILQEWAFFTNFSQEINFVLMFGINGELSINILLYLVGLIFSWQKNFSGSGMDLDPQADKCILGPTVT